MKIIQPSVIPRSPLIAGIPHSSAVIPKEARSAFTISDHAIQEELRLLTDWFTDELYSAVYTLGGVGVVHEVSRFVVDPERFADDSKEVMASRGMGVIYEKGCFEQVIKQKPNSLEREELLLRYYWPYHEALTRCTQTALERFNQAIFVDCHSFPAKSLPYELSADASRPDIAIGTDPVHTPKILIEEIQKICRVAGFSFGIDEPFSGTVVPNSYYGDRRVTAFMIEVNRRLYMDEKQTKKLPQFFMVQDFISQLLKMSLRVLP